MFIQTTISIPRWIGTSSTSNLQHHGFSDGSENAYTAVIYVRSEDPITGECTSNIVCSKTRVAPLKILTIPCLELSGAHLLAKLMKTAQKALGNITECFYWTDSRIVQHWIQTPPNKLKSFVANRVAQIQELTESRTWKSFPTEYNPADIASRGCAPSQLKDNKLW